MENKVDYLLVLSPPKSIVDHVRIDKRYSEKLIGNFESLNSKAHLTMSNYFLKNTYEVEPLIPHLQYKMSMLPSITLNINGYNYFETGNKRTIYASPTIDSDAELWFEQMRDHVKSNSITPHITIAKNISEEQFEILWSMFKDRKWIESFHIDRLTILKRQSIGLNNNYVKLKELEFKNDKLIRSFIYKNRRRRIKPRGPFSGDQMELF